MRLRIVELPYGKVGDVPPFMIVFDQATPGDVEVLADGMHRLAEDTGAKSVLVTASTVTMAEREEEAEREAMEKYGPQRYVTGAPPAPDPGWWQRDPLAIVPPDTGPTFAGEIRTGGTRPGQP